MAVSIRCPNPSCGKASMAPDDINGRQVRCKHCGRVFTATNTVDDIKAATRSANIHKAVEPKSLIGRFQVLAKLGAGAFGTVYRCYDPQLDREVALKVPNAGSLESPKRVERFLREARAAANLRHPGIVPVYETGKDGDSYFIASAFVDGRKLTETFDESGTELERAARLARELAEALAYAHEQGIVHRDVKPDNIMIDSNDHVHLMDFGLASRLDDESKLTNDGAVMGTPGYMAPEQAAGQQGEAQPAADQYSVGIVLYELLTGKVPFEGPSAIVIHNQIHTTPERPSKFRRDIPKDLETICLKAISKQAGDRYVNCQHLADDLRRWLEDEPITARRLNVIERFSRWSKKNTTVALLTSLAISFLVTGVIISSVLSIRADASAKQANDEAKRADASAKQANDEAARANEEKRRADNETQATRIALESSEQNLSNFRLLLAQKEFVVENNASRAHELLDSIPEKYRNFEWRLAKRSYHAGLFELRGHSDTVLCAEFSPDGLQIVSASMDKSLRVWDVKSGLTVNELTGHSEYVYCAEFSPDGLRIASGSGDKTIRIWDARTGQTLRKIEGHTGGVFRLSYSPDGRRIASQSGDRTFQIWDAESGRQLLEIKNPGQEIGHSSLSFSPDGERIASGCSLDLLRASNGEVRIWDSISGKPLVEFKVTSERVSSLSFSPDGNRVVTGSSDNAVRTWDSKTGKLILELSGHTQPVTTVSFSRDGSRIVSGSGFLGMNGEIRVWDANSGKCLKTLKGHTGAVKIASFNPQGTQRLSGKWSCVQAQPHETLAAFLTR